jgi:hypothetical protein
MRSAFPLWPIQTLPMWGYSREQIRCAPGPRAAAPLHEVLTSPLPISTGLCPKVKREPKTEPAHGRAFEAEWDWVTALARVATPYPALGLRAASPRTGPDAADSACGHPASAVTRPGRPGEQGDRPMTWRP